MRIIQKAFLIFVLFAGFPITAAAMKSETFEFSAGAVNATWEGKGPIQMTQTPSGILLQTTGTGLFVTDTKLSLFPQVGTVTISAESPALLYFVWIYDADPDQHNYNVPIDIPFGGAEITPFSLSEVTHWNRGDKRIGIVLPPHTTILLHQIRFDALNIFERTLEAVRSFWTFDLLRTYSINFVWGPQFASNPIERHALFMTQPPTSLSATYVFNGILLLACILFAALSFWFPEKKQRALKALCIVMLAVWLLMDLRMGTEFLSWVLHDRATYIQASPAVRVFRDRDRFYDFAHFAKPLVSDRQSYIFFAERQWPYLGNMRYITYPAIPGIDFAQDDTWVMYRRTDIAVNAANQLTIDGEPITQAGEILGRFDDMSFVFRATPLLEPSPQP